MTLVHRLSTLSLLLASGCANCDKDNGSTNEDPAAYGKPEPPVIVHTTLKDGGRGPTKFIDLAERRPLFDAGPAEPTP